jgi:GntR family transcriptional regulator
MTYLIQNYTMLDLLHIEANGVPIYVQIRDQMLRAIGAKRIPPGEQMPTMREVAVALKVDLNTVRHAYEELEKTGAIVIRRARGTFVAEAPPPPDRQARAKRIEHLAQQAIALASAAGVDANQVAKAMLQLTATKGERK